MGFRAGGAGFGMVMGKDSGELPDLRSLVGSGTREKPGMSS